MAVGPQRSPPLISSFYSWSASRHLEGFWGPEGKIHRLTELKFAAQNEIPTSRVTWVKITANDMPPNSYSFYR